MPSPIEYAKDEWDELQHCMACTVHKSQGAEYPCVILVQHPSQYNMLQRNLIYTGVTRAKKLCVIAGTRRAVEIAVGNDKEVIRNTTLAELLQEATQ
jgi:exodeoxyribonuclease V alpha subunit